MKSFSYPLLLFVGLFHACSTVTEPLNNKATNVEEVVGKVGLTESLLPSEPFSTFKQHENDRSFHADIAFYETVLSYGPIEDPNPVFLLTNAYIASNQQDYGIPYFESIIERFSSRMSDRAKSSYLSAYALLRASYAERVGILSRIGWIKNTFGILEEAKALSDDNPLVYWASGIVYAQVPKFFNKRKEAMVNLRWLESHPELEPTPGFYREVYHHMSKLYLEDGKQDLADAYLAKSGYTDYVPKQLFSGWFSTTKEKGLLFAPKPSIEEVVHGRLFALRGFGFSDLHFVVSKDGKELISIDAGTQPFSLKAGHEFLMEHYPNLPPLRNAIITHAHWDHVGGHSYFKSLDSTFTFYGRENFHDTVERVLKNHSYHQFRGFGFKAHWVGHYAPDSIISTRRRIHIGGSEIELIPVSGGETEDALLAHFPELEVVFMGDALMPFYGEPWTEEGDIDGALDVMDTTLELNPKHLLHGHIGITVLYEDKKQLQLYRNAYKWLVNETRTHLRNGYSAKDIIRLNLIPPGIQNTPEIFIGYLSPRDHVIARTADHMVGIWQEEVSGKDPEGLDVITAVERGRLLELYLDLSEKQVARALEKMLENGDNELALQMAIAAENRYGKDGKITPLKEEAADRLRSSVQFFDPFKFVTYTEIIDKEHHTMPGKEHYSHQ